MATRKDSVEGLKDKLYSRTDDVSGDPNDRTPLSERHSDIPVGWNEPPMPPVPPPQTLQNMASPKKGWSLASKFFLVSIFFFIVAAGGAGYIFFYGNTGISPQNIDIQVVMPSVIDGGKASGIQVLIHNRNQANLKLANLVINYPDGTRSTVDPEQALKHEKQTIGSISAGQTVQRTAQAIFYGQEGQTQDVSVQLEYSIEGSNAVFEKNANASFTVGSSPVSISISAPAEAISNQQFSFDVTVQSNSLGPVQDVVIQARYPFGFTVGKTSPEAQVGGTLWRLGEMKPGDSKVLHITGTLDGQDGDTRVFYFLAGSDSDETNTTVKVPFLSVPATLVVHRPFITAQLAVNGKTGRTISIPSTGSIEGAVSWTNNLPDPISDVEITLSLAGPTLDTDSVGASTGFYQSSDTTIVWSKDQNQQLALVPPGGTGTFPFHFSTKAPGAGGTLYSNPAITLNVAIKGVRQGQTDVPEHVVSAASSQVYVSSITALTAVASHFTGPFSNTGPMPPTPGQPTTYTITWTVTNTSNTIANGVVSATLPTYVTYLAAPQGSGISYDPGSRTVTWTLGDVKAGTGFTNPARTASFQVSLLPSASQRGTSPSLTGAASFMGQDRFAQVQVNATAAGPTTALGSEQGYTPAMGIIPQ